MTDRDNPDFKIARDGTWFHNNAPIQREALARLFSDRALKIDEHGQYWLATPFEQYPVEVEDVPYVIVDYELQAKAAGDVLVQVLGVRGAQGELFFVEVVRAHAHGPPRSVGVDLHRGRRAGAGAVPGVSAQPVNSKAAGRVEIVTENLNGSINLLGARIDDLKLIKYHRRRP